MDRIAMLRRFGMAWNILVTVGLLAACVWLVIKTGSLGAAWDEAEKLLPLTSVMTWAISIGVVVPAMAANWYAGRLEAQLEKEEPDQG